MGTLAGSCSTGGVRAPWMARVAKPGRRSSSSSVTTASRAPALGVPGPEVAHQAGQLRHHVVGHDPEHRGVVLAALVLGEVHGNAGLDPDGPAELQAPGAVALPHVLR